MFCSATDPLGTLLTFVQFLFVASTGYISQFDRNRAPHFLKPNKVPIRRWLINILLFFTINVLNNHAFSYNISVPIHIILRSGGSITTLVAGYLWGKKFSRLQVFAVTLLTVGVVIAAWSDQQAKVQSSNSIWDNTNNTYRKTPRSLMDFHRLALDLPYFSLRRFCLLSWAYIPRKHTENMARTGKRISSILISSHYRSSRRLYLRCTGNS